MKRLLLLLLAILILPYLINAFLLPGKTHPKAVAFIDSLYFGAGAMGEFS